VTAIIIGANGIDYFIADQSLVGIRKSFMQEKINSIMKVFLAFTLVFSAATNIHAAASKKSPATPSKIQTILFHAPSTPKPLIDTAKVRSLYLDGDFDEAIKILETGIKEKRPFDHDDSVFFCKHLGVMYAAKYDTREKGKYYMHMLLMVEPTARILDMYASDMIYMIFKNIQDEFDQTRMRLGRAEKNLKGNAQTDSLPITNTQKPNSESKRSSGHPLIWVGATTAVVGVGVVAYFIFNNSQSTKHVDAAF
jgi:hypothetical protein